MWRVRVSAPWLAVLALYAAAVLLLGAADPSPQVPPLLERLQDATSPRAVELVLAAAMALAFGLGAALARRWVPEPWATRGVLMIALSPLGFAASAGVGGGAAAAALLAAGLVLTLRVHDHPTRGAALGAAACLALVPWFGLAYAAPAVVVLAALVSWTYRRKRPLLGLLELELAGLSVVALLGADQPGGRSRPGTLAAVLVDRETGILRWAPALGLAGVGAYLLVRSRQERVSKAIPARRDGEVAAALACLALLGALGAAALGSVSAAAALPPAAALGAWGLQRAPRAGGLLSALTLAGTVWVTVQLAAGSAPGWLSLASDAPWGPLVDVFPLH